jgi:hypothetical protein
MLPLHFTRLRVSTGFAVMLPLLQSIKRTDKESKKVIAYMATAAVEGCALDIQVANTHTGVYAPTGLTDEGLRTHLAPWRHARVLDLRNILPGTFGGFTRPAPAAAVDRAVFALFDGQSWCCSGEQPMNTSHLDWRYAVPEKLARRIVGAGTLSAPFEPRPVPQYRRPDFCDDIRSDPKNARFLEFENHPCTFLAMGLQLPATVDEVFASH